MSQPQLEAKHHSCDSSHPLVSAFPIISGSSALQFDHFGGNQQVACYTVLVSILIPTLAKVGDLHFHIDDEHPLEKRYNREYNPDK
jgi:hypothetical protein